MPINTSGYTDWRLPNIKELESITDDSRYNPAIDTNLFLHARGFGYWSSTSHANDPYNAWIVYFYHGYVSGGSKLVDYLSGRCVRGGSGGSGVLELSPLFYNFGEIAKGTSSEYEQFTIRNAGTGNLWIYDIAVADTNNFDIDTTDNIVSGCNPGVFGRMLTPGGSCTFSVRFKPTIIGPIDSYITISSNDPDASGLFNISGTGADDDFVWPIDPLNPSSGHYAQCEEWSKDPNGCYWLTDSVINKKTNYADYWRDVQPFQAHLYRHKGKTLGYHLGADYNLGSGSYDANKPIYPISSGLISNVLSNVCRWGNIIFVKHFTTFGVHVYTSMYAHVNWIGGLPPEKGTPVSKDQPIALLGNGTWNCGKGNTGSWDYHLHFELREGEDTTPGKGYSTSVVSKGINGQIDPNGFISSHR